MKARALIGLLVLVVCVFSVVSALADEVEVKDGRVFSGVITSGIPELLNIDVNGVISTIRRTSIREIRYESGNAGTIETVKGDVLKGSLTTEMPAHTVIKTDVGAVTINITGITRITFESSVSVGTENPWDYIGLEGLVGTLGVVVGGLVVGGGGFSICALIADDPLSCLVIGGIGYIVGSLVVPIIAVDAVGKAHDVRGNLGLAFLMEVGGGVFGLLLDSAFGTPLRFTILGTGFGAATGYNIGAEIVTQPMATKQGEIQLVSMGIQF